MKECFKCGGALPLTQFYKHKAMRDGYLNKCKDCTKKDVLDHRTVNIERIREYDKSRANLPHRVAARKAYAKTEAYKISCINGNRRYRQRNPKKYQAHTLVNNAIRDGKLFKEPCEVCQTITGVHAHHDDYAKPLNIRWLCHEHHRQWHEKHGEAKNA